LFCKKIIYQPCIVNYQALTYLTSLYIIHNQLNTQFRSFKTGVKSKTEKLAPAASLVSFHHLKPRTGLVGPVSVLLTG